MVKGLYLFRDRFRQFEGSFTSRYDITTYSPLRHWKVGPGSESWRRGSGWPGPHGREVCPRLRRASRGYHHVPFQERGCNPPWHARGRYLTEFTVVTC